MVSIIQFLTNTENLYIAMWNTLINRELRNTNAFIRFVRLLYFPIHDQSVVYVQTGISYALWRKSLCNIKLKLIQERGVKEKCV